MINISDFVWTKNYTLKNLSCVSFIENIKSGDNYVLSGVLSLLWQIISEKQNYNDIIKIAKEKNISHIVDDFLSELKYKGLITTDLPLKYKKSNYMLGCINEKSENYNLFSNLTQNFITCNNFLGHIDFNLNYSCNLNCKHCFNPKNMNKYEIKFKEAKQIIDEAYELGVYSVNITGGECTLCKDFFKIAEYIRKRKLRLSILTNGQKLYDDKLLFENLISIYPSRIQLSLYSMNPDIHDNITGVQGSHYKTLSLIKKLRKKNINTVISCFQTSLNYDSFSEVNKFAKSINADFITDCRFKYNKNNNNLYTKLPQKKLVDFYLKTIDLNNTRSNNLKCSGGIDRLAIMPNLEVNPCNYCYFFGGKYKVGSLRDIRKKLINNFQQKIKRENLKECYKQDYCKYCIYCPGYTCVSNDNFLSKSEILCEDAKAYYEAYMQLKNK